MSAYLFVHGCHGDTFRDTCIGYPNYVVSQLLLETLIFLAVLQKTSALDLHRYTM